MHCCMDSFELFSPVLLYFMYCTGTQSSYVQNSNQFTLCAALLYTDVCASVPVACVCGDALWSGNQLCRH